MRTCLTCGACIDHKRSDARYCDQKCKGKASDRRRASRGRRSTSGYRQPLPPRPAVTRACEHCGDGIDMLHPRARFCGDSCRYKARYLRKREKIKAKAVAHYWKNRDRELERSRSYRKVNRDRRRHLDDIRHARMRGNPGYTPFEHSEWLRLVNRHDGRCAYCQTPCESLEMDHVIPLSRGGRHALANILPACPSCNRRKSSKLLIEWRYRNDWR